MALTDNIVAYWKQDESSGNAIDSVASFDLTNTNTVGYAAALINNGSDMGTTNTNKRLLINDDLGIGNGNLSISGWAKVRTAPASGVTHTFFDWRFDAGGADREMWIRYTNTAGTLQMMFSYPDQNASVNGIVHNIDLGTSVWHHFVGTYDGTYIRFYVDGTQQGGDVVVTSPTGTVSDAFCIGATGNGFVFGSEYFDETGVWSRALTSGEVTSLYNSGAGLAYPFTSATNSNFLMFM